jgi:hypothetical protein
VSNPPERCLEICDGENEPECLECIAFGPEEAEAEKETKSVLDNENGAGNEIIIVPEICEMDIETTKNPGCSSAPVAVFKPKGSQELPRDLLYDFQFGADQKTVTFKVWPNIDQSDPDLVDVYVEYSKSHNDANLIGDWTCDKFKPECELDEDDLGGETIKEITAVCPHGITERAFTIVRVNYILRGEADQKWFDSNHDINKCCGADLEGEDDIIDPVASYEFKVYCDCPATEVA